MSVTLTLRSFSNESASTAAEAIARTNVERTVAPSVAAGLGSVLWYRARLDAVLLGFSANVIELKLQNDLTHTVSVGPADTQRSSVLQIEDEYLLKFEGSAPTRPPLSWHPKKALDRLLSRTLRSVEVANRSETDVYVHPTADERCPALNFTGYRDERGRPLLVWFWDDYGPKVTDSANPLAANRE